MNALRTDLQAIVTRLTAGAVSAPIALMEMLLRSPDADAIAGLLPTLDAPAHVLGPLTALAAEHEAGCRRIAAMLRRGLDESEPAHTVEHGIERTRALFDDSVAQSEEASVALYSLGSAELLAECTAEAIDVMDRWGVLDASRDALDLGCGIGRFLVPLAPRLRSLVGIDVSAGMVASAESRVRERANVCVRRTSGYDLEGLTSSSFDLVYSVDAFPYIVLAGGQLARRHFEEVARVLRPGGDFLLFSYAYNRPRAVDADEVAAHARAAGLTVIRSDETPFRLWGAVAYHLLKP